MNFFGHAVVAVWRSSSRPFVLGAMLPDFATMIGARVPRVSHAELAGGVDFHHETDRVFHQAPTFVELQRRARAELRERGVGRGGALAVAHVGVEILLDTFLARDANAREAYMAALAAGSGKGLAPHIVWSGITEPFRFEVLRKTLLARGVSPGRVDAETVTLRLERALAGRPRLALEAHDLDEVQQWAEQAAVEVEESAGRLIEEVRAGLGL